MSTIFEDRFDAGIRLSRALSRYRIENPVVLALPRGGVEVAYPIAVALAAPLDVLCVRKIGAPGHEELGLGAVAEEGVVFLDRDTLRGLRIDERSLAPRIARKKKEVEARVVVFRGERPRVSLAGRTVILVDDGIATGGTMEAALTALRAHKPARIVIAVPVAAPSSVRRLTPLADEVVVLETPLDLYAVAEWYDDFRQVSDERVVELLETRHDSLERRAG